MASPKKLVKLQGIYLDKVKSIGKADLPELLKVADVYDEWFRDTFIPYLEKQLTISQGAWQLTDDSAIHTINAGRFLRTGCVSIVVDGVSQWLSEPEEDPRIIRFYREGLELWRLNMEALGLPRPKKVKINKRDSTVIKNWLTTFNETWQNHLNKHIRTVNRFIDAGQQNGWTTEKFLDNCVCPDGHIIGFRYGNSRYSWAEHLRRFGKARSKVMAQVAQQERMGGDAESR